MFGYLEPERTSDARFKTCHHLSCLKGADPMIPPSTLASEYPAGISWMPQRNDFKNLAV